MDVAARSFVNRQYAVTTLKLEYNNDTGKKVTYFKPRWQQATVENCMQEFVKSSDNAIVVVTGEPSDLLVIDADSLKPKEIGVVEDGMVVLNQKIEEFGLDPIPPTQTTGSGGKHLFFSVSKSVEAGLMSTSNRSKIFVDGKPTSLDVRADGGGIICHPTKYRAADSLRSYTFEVPLCHRDKLMPAPQWLIDILNRDTARMNAPRPARAVALRSPQNLQIAATDAFFTAVKAVLEIAIGNKVQQQWPRQTGFDFSVQDKDIPCICCGGLHTSNNFACRQILTKKKAMPFCN